MLSTLIGFKWNCKQRDNMVTGNFCGSVVARRNFTYSGGSSKVLSKALKLCLESICTSSIRYTLKRPRAGLYCTLSSSSLVSSTLVLTLRQFLINQQSALDRFLGRYRTGHKAWLLYLSRSLILWQTNDLWWSFRLASSLNR